MRRGIVAVVLPLVFFGALAVARADEVDERGRLLTIGDPYKVRLSAAIWLSRRPSSDGRTVSMLAGAMLTDKESTVRRLCAVALGKMVSPETPSAARARARSALDKAAATDRDRTVRKNARQALAAIDARIPVVEEADEADGLGGIFVHVGPAIDVSKKLPDGVAGELETVVRDAVVHGAPHYAVSKRGTTLPTGAELRAARQRGFYVGSSVASLTSTRKGTAVEVSCKVSVRVTAWSGEDGGERLAADQSASASGSGTVTATPRGAAGAMADCVTAVGGEVTTRQVVPFLRRFEKRAGR